MTENAPTLPGLELSRPGENRIAATALETLRDLDERGLLIGKHAVNAQLILGLAQSVGAQLAAGRLSIAAVTAAKQLAELIETLPGDADSDAAAALIRELQEAK